MRPTVSTVRPVLMNGPSCAAAVSQPLTRLAVTAGVSALWIGAYVFVTARALNLV